jgi:putative transposase
LSACGEASNTRECHLKAYGAVSAARADIADYLDWYNAHRPHSSLERLAPDEKYFAALPPMKMAA